MTMGFSENDMPRTVSAPDLRASFDDGAELALVDAREEGAFTRSHLLYASSLPLSRIEERVADLIPRRGTRIVVCDAGEGVAARAAARLEQLGYTDVSVLDGGVAGWSAAGYELFSGFNVPSKAFGEFVEHAYHTPSVSADELKAMLDSGQKMVVLDSRPMDEFNLMNIPTGICCPGGELVYRLHDIAPDPDTTVVVNCAGRTRSIMGAQSLINAGVPNKVVALRNGTMGWHLAGYQVERGNIRPAPDPSPAGLAAAKQRAEAVARRFGVSRVEPETLARWRSEASTRSLYVLDVRSPEEFEAGHMPEAVSAPGGQLVQATDRYIGTRNARVVLVDDTEVRATMTAHWLKQMNWDVHVLAGGMPRTGLETGKRRTAVLGLDGPAPEGIAAAELKRLIDAGEAVVVDLADSRRYRRGHIPGAWFAVRSRFATAAARLPQSGRLVLASPDGVLARLAASELAAAAGRPVAVLTGGTAAWSAAGLPLAEGEEHMADEADDVWLRPYERPGTVEDSMNEYLSWEINLVNQIERDGSVRFMTPPPA